MIYRISQNGEIRRHDLEVTQTQALCLLLFNEATELTVEEMSKATGVGRSIAIHVFFLLTYLNVS